MFIYTYLLTSYMLGTFDTNYWIRPSDPIRIWTALWSYDPNANMEETKGWLSLPRNIMANGMNPSLNRGNGCSWSRQSSNMGPNNLPVRLRSGTQEPAATVAAAEKSKVCNRDVSWQETKIMTGQPTPLTYPTRNKALTKETKNWGCCFLARSKCELEDCESKH